jgi:glycosyltransferase involved in cell wall biosynthesis
MKTFASLCVLAYKRPERLQSCLETLILTADYPYELIINLDGGDYENRILLAKYLNDGRLSKVIFSGGDNRGVGRSFANCIGVAEGQYIVKIDTDLTFSPHWLSTSVRILEDNPTIGALSLFNYRNYDPNDTRFEITGDAEDRDFYLVNDFVSSIYGFRRKDLVKGGWDQDDGFHSRLGQLAITKKDYVKNHGFGVTKSTYVSGTEDNPYKTPTHDLPLLFQDKD